MADSNQQPENELLSCEVCISEVPASAAASEEASDYFYHFCGVECHQKWQEQQQTDES
jgi:hypothetical protein